MKFFKSLLPFYSTDWKSFTLILAGIYNIAWGAWTVLFPLHLFKLTGIQPPHYPELWQCIGMVVGVYGLGYIAAAFAPLKHWPIVLVGFLGKIFGPIGFVMAIVNDVFPLRFGWTIVFNDLIWWVPFGLILHQAYKRMRLSKEKILVDSHTFSAMPDRDRARFINSLTGFKSANLIGTINSKGQTNVSIVSSAFHLGANPALLGFIIRPDLSPRHTLDNLRESKFCTLNHVNKAIVDKAHQTSARYPEDVSEFEACGLTEEFKNDFKAPFVAESNIQLALELVREEKLPENGTHLIIAKIIDVYIPKDALSRDGHVDIEKAQTICISGLDSYHSTDRLARLSYAKPDKPLSKVKE